MSLKLYKYFSAIFAFILWGSWTYYINQNAQTVFISSFSQGLASFIITLIMVDIIAFFYNKFPKEKNYFLFPSIITVFLTSTTITIIHLLVHTENILYTILPNIFVAFIFSLLTTHKLVKLEGVS